VDCKNCGLGLEHMPAGIALPDNVPAAGSQWALDARLIDVVDGCIGAQVGVSIETSGTKEEMAARVTGATVYDDLKDQGAELMRFISAASEGRLPGVERMEKRILVWLKATLLFLPKDGKGKKRLFDELEKRRRAEKVDKRHGAFFTGQKVTARWLQGNGLIDKQYKDWYGATVQKVNGDGTYAVLFDDGTQCADEPFRWIRPRVTM